MKRGFIIAIDGPVAVGKGTVAKLLAQRLDAFYLYSGAFFRCVALFCIKKGIDLENEDDVEQAAHGIHIELNGNVVFLDNIDVSQEILQQVVAQGASKIAVYPKVRVVGNTTLRTIAEKALDRGEIVVTEGRDTGSAMFPNARIKIFLTAEATVRAARRLRQLEERGDKTKTYSEVLRETRERDKRDSERTVDPLVSNPRDFGYEVFDNSKLTEEESLALILALLKRKKLIQ